MTARVLAALRVLRFVADRPDPTAAVAVGEVSARLGVELSTASRVCTELDALGALERAGGPGVYRLGRTAIEVSGLAASRFARAVRYALTLLAQQTGETACLAAGADGDVRIVASIASAWTLYSPGDLGEPVADVASAIARAAAGDRLRSTASFFESTIGSCVEVAVPVVDLSGRPRAVLAVRMPTNRAEAGLPRARHALLAARRSIERALAEDVPPVADTVSRDERPVVTPPVGALAAALAVLRHLALTDDHVASIARAVGISVDRAQRVVEHCRAAGLVGIDPARQVSLDWRMHGWYRAATAPLLLARAAPLVARTADASAVCTFVTVLRGMRSVTLIEELRDSGPGLRMLPWLGRPAPITESDGGPALVSDLGEDELATVFPRRHSQAEVAAFARRVRNVTRDGVAAHEYTEDAGILSITAPVRDSSGTVAAAVCIVGPSERLRPQLADLMAAARALADDASAVLGGRAA